MKSDKLIPKRRFKEFENDEAWEQRKLGDVATKIGDGLHGTPQYTEEGNIYFINGNNLVDGKVVITDETKKVTEKEQSPADLELDKNTILMSINGTIGNLALYNEEKLMLGKSAAYIKIEKIDREFLFYTLQTKGIRDYFFSNLTGTTIKNLGLKTIKDTRIFVPNSQEQNKIISVFSNLDNLITLHQCKLKKLKELKLAYLSEMFPEEGEKYPKRRFAGFTDPWEQRKLGDICNINGRIGFRGYTQNDIISKDDGGILTFSPTNIVNNSLTMDVKNTYITEKKYEESPEIKISNGDILFVKTGSTLGKSALVKGLCEKATINPQIIVMRTDINLRKFLSVVLLSNPIQKQVTISRIGGAVPTLTEAKIKSFELKVPKKEDELIRIGVFFEQLDYLITLHQRKLEKLENMKKAYLNEMFV